MDLPIFQDNLRSSGGWAAELERAQRNWLNASAEARSRTSALQIRRALSRISLSGAIVAEEAYGEAARLVSLWGLDPNLSLDLNRLRGINVALLGGAAGSGVLRTGEARRLGAYHDPAPGVILPRLVENALDWFQTQSFSEIHPVERAAIVLLRITDLQPFESLNEETALLAASLFLERASLPPLILEADEETMNEYSVALEAAFRMLTQPLVEFLSKTLIRIIAQANV
jgi:hypothetical protein